MFLSQPTTNPILEELLKQARNHKMTPKERVLQRVSFAYGNLAIDHPEITREMVEEADRELHPEDYPPND